MNLRGSIITLILVASAMVTIFKLTPGTTSSNVANEHNLFIKDAARPMHLIIIANIGPWPYASRLIGYRGRLWFANSVKFRNHNSADIWSLNPQTGEKRLERNLFSQDAGTPLIYKDLLYWPLEDALLAGGKGEIAVTDGDNWRSYTIDSALMYHTSELHEWQGNLLAVTGAHHAGLQLSNDKGKSWKELYDHPAPDRRIARIKSIVTWKNNVYATLRDAKTQRLVKWTGNGFEMVPGFPLNRLIRGLTAHNDALYALVGRGKEREIWRYDGNKSEGLGRQDSFADITSDGKLLWAVTRQGKLYSINKDIWQRHRNITGGTPLSIDAIDGSIYVAGTGNNKYGIIWGPKKHNITSEYPPAALPPSQYPIQQSNQNWDILGKKIDTILSNKENYEIRKNNILDNLLQQAIRNGAPDGFCAQRLKADIPNIKISTFGGNINTKATDIAYVMLLKCMEKTGYPNVPLEFLAVPWTAKSNSYEKYLSVPLAALKTISSTKQNDKATIAALIARLDYNDPDWFQSQVIGTLTAVTDKHFGYDVAAWKEYYQNGDSKDSLSLSSRP